VLSIAKWVFPNHIVTSEELGRAMLGAARQLPVSTVIETKDIVQLARA
jgi:hypothetical protein